MSSSGFFNKFLGKAFLGGNKYISCHGYVSLDAYCCHFVAFFLHCSQLFRGGGALCHGPTLADALQKSETDLKR